MYILIGSAVILLGFVVVVAMQPSQFRVNRQADMDAPAEMVFSLVNDFRQWRAWSPWEGKDPNLQRSYAGSSSGSGAIYGWVGNKQVGEGRMTITESLPPSLIRILLEFIKPFPGVCNTEFTFTPTDSGTHVSWTMTGKHNFIQKAFCMFMNMDKMIGGDFEKGLEAMKSAAESTVRV
jgi:uncharacterized protein YndB with AHSA1/START domain